MKKKLSEVAESEEKLMAVDALGVVMIKHGEEFGEDSAYGQSLVSLGRAHCNIATLQESFALTFEETYLTAVRQSEDEIKEYQMQRKKLECRRWVPSPFCCVCVRVHVIDQMTRHQAQL